MQTLLESLTQRARDDAEFRAQLESAPEAALSGAGLSAQQIETAVAELAIEPEVEGQGFNRQSMLAMAVATTILSGGVFGRNAPARAEDAEPLQITRDFTRDTRQNTNPADIFVANQRSGSSGRDDDSRA